MTKHFLFDTFRLLLKLSLDAIGVLLIYIGAFVYRDEMGRLHNRLTELWVSVTELEERAVPWQTALIRRASSILTVGLDRALGPGWISLGMILTSICLSLSSAFLLEPFTKLDWTWPNHPLCLLIGLNLLATSLELPGALEAKRYTYIAICVTGQVGVVCMYSLRVLQRLDLRELLAEKQTVIETLVMLGLTIFFGLAIDVLFLLFSRFLLRRLAYGRRGWPFVLLFVVNLFWAAVLGCTIHFAMGSLSLDAATLLERNPRLLKALHLTFLETVNAVCIAASTNGYNFLLASGLVLLLMVAFLHRLMYPAFQRLIMAFSEFFISANRKLLIGVGAGFLALGGIPLSTFLSHFHF